MISNQNNLKFSHKLFKNNEQDGILNQNPLIITKNEAFTFAYADPNRLRYAQLLARRDLSEIKAEIEAKKIEVVPEIVSKVPKLGRCEKSMVKKSHVEDRAKSVKRLPGPHTPSKISDRRRGGPSILKFQEMPTRSMSPPVKDTDTTWKPRESDNVIEKLQSQVDKYADKVDRLERALQTKSEVSIPTVAQSNIILGKTGRDLKVLEDKLRSMIGIHPAQRVDYISPSDLKLQSYQSQLYHPQSYSFQVNPPQTNPMQSNILQTHPSQLHPPIDDILNRLDSLATEMDTIKSRWSSLPYENVSTYADDDNIPLDFRFTKQVEEYCKQTPANVEDQRVCLDIPRQLVVRLDRDRKQFKNVNRIPKIVSENITPARAGEWFSEDIVGDIVDDVIKEIDDINGELVEDILNEELSD